MMRQFVFSFKTCECLNIKITLLLLHVLSQQLKLHYFIYWPNQEKIKKKTYKYHDII